MSTRIGPRPQRDEAGHTGTPAAAGAPTVRMPRIRGRIPRAALVCALIACLNAACWSILIPPFEIPDEPDHFAYVKQLADTGSLPSSSNAETSSREVTDTLYALHYERVRLRPQSLPIATVSEQEELERTLATTPRDSGSADAGVATSEPPLYYALEVVPYELARGGTVLDRLALMRLASALFAGLTALFAFLFVREALPERSWAWTVGGLAVALAPLLAEMSGAVNPDALLFAVSAALFYCLARAFRRGLDTPLAGALGAVTAVGLLTKVNFVGLLPGIVLGVLLLSLRARQAYGRSALRLLALALGIGFSPVIVIAFANAASGHPLLGLVSRSISSSHGSIFVQLDYIWQLYLPRLPGTTDYFPGLFTTRQLWFDGYVGLYGWIDTQFPGWVYSAALVPTGAIALLCLRTLLGRGAALRARIGELAVYATLCIGVLVLTGADSFRAFPAFDAEFAQARYLLPMVALFGAIVALAARGAGRRWGPVVGALLVTLFLAHDLFSQLQVIARYYG